MLLIIMITCGLFIRRIISWVVELPVRGSAINGATPSSLLKRVNDNMGSFDFEMKWCKKKKTCHGKLFGSFFVVIVCIFHVIPLYLDLCSNFIGSFVSKKSSLTILYYLLFYTFKNSILKGIWFTTKQSSPFITHPS